MTRKTTNKRLDAAAHAIGSQPLAPQAIDHEYAKFLRSGDVPHDRRLGWAVLNRALHARKAAAHLENDSSSLLPLGNGSPPPRRVTGSPRDQVFKEAVHSFEPARMAARTLISLLVGGGTDPTDPEFIPSDLELPEFGSVAMSALGWPDQWVKPPFEPQMQRVMQQHTLLRAHTVRTEAWYRDAAAGLAAFMTRGNLPTDDAVQLFALTIGEMFALHAHYFGKGDEALLAAFEAASRAMGPEREAALLHLGTLQAQTREAR